LDKKYYIPAPGICKELAAVWPLPGQAVQTGLQASTMVQIKHPPLSPSQAGQDADQGQHSSLCLIRREVSAPEAPLSEDSSDTYSDKDLTRNIKKTDITSGRTAGSLTIARRLVHLLPIDMRGKFLSYRAVLLILTPSASKYYGSTILTKG
jgi:hypothetical protein